MKESRLYISSALLATAIVMYYTLSYFFGESFLLNVISVPCWVFGSFLVGGFITILLILIDHCLDIIIDFFELLTKKQKTITIIIISIVFMIGIPIIIEVI
jgi:hypothetical protein